MMKSKLELLNFTSFAKQWNYDRYAVGLYIIFAWNFFIVILLCYLCRKEIKRKEFNKNILRFFKITTFLTSTIFLIPLLDYQMTILICNEGFLNGSIVLINSMPRIT